jgi:hypothetical protein
MAKETLVHAKDTVTVFGTGLSKHLPEGVESAKIHKIAADKLVASGKATYEKGAAKSSKKGGKEA